MHPPLVAPQLHWEGGRMPATAAVGGGSAGMYVSESSQNFPVYVIYADLCCCSAEPGTVAVGASMQCYCYACDIKAADCKYWGNGE
jgi:hypothetical protein